MDDQDENYNVREVKEIKVKSIFTAMMLQNIILKSEVLLPDGHFVRN